MAVRWKRFLALAVTGFWLWFVFSRSARTAEESSLASAVILDMLRPLFPALTDTVIRKAAHFTEYFILGILLWTDWRLIGWGPALLPSGIGCAVAFVDEMVIQTHTPGRSGELRDVLIDSAGVLLAVVIFQLLRRRKERKPIGHDRKKE